MVSLARLVGVACGRASRSRVVLTTGYVLAVLAYVESMTHPLPFVPFGYAPFLLAPVLIGVYIALGVWVCYCLRRHRVSSMLLLLFFLFMTVVCPIVHERLLWVRFELGRSKIEDELVAIYNGHSTVRRRPVGDGFTAVVDRWIGSYYIIEVHVDPHVRYASVTTGACGLGVRFGFSTRDFDLIGTTPRVMHWTLWSASR